MEHVSTRKGLKVEQLLLLAVIALGFYGLSIALGDKSSNQQFEQYAHYASYNQFKSLNNNASASSRPVSIHGSYLEGDAMKFTLNVKKLGAGNLSIDFGNGTEYTLADTTFTYAYPSKGYYTLSIKQKNKVVYTKRIKIEKGDYSNYQLVMN